MLLVDTVKGEVLDDAKLKEQYVSRQPYGEWLNNNLVELKDLFIPNQKVEYYDDATRAKLQRAFGYTYEEYKTMMLPMARDGAEAVSAMGNDGPLAVLSGQHPPILTSTDLLKIKAMKQEGFTVKTIPIIYYKNTSQGSQIFEAIGISSDVINQYFTDTVSRVEGITLSDIEADVNFHHGAAFDSLGL